MFAVGAVLTSITSLAAAVAPWAWGPGLAPADWDELASRDIHARAIVVDTHCDVTQRMLYSGADFVAGIPGAHLDLAKMREGGLDAEFFSIFVAPRTTTPDKYFSESMRQIAAVTEMARRSQGRVALARTAADVRRNAARGVPSAMMGVEGGHALGNGSEADQLANLRKFGAAGVRYMTLTWTNTNPIGGSSGDDGKTRGLTPFGRQVIDEMNRLGIMVDLSHVSDPLFWDAIRYTRKPVLLSHSSSRALADVPRNITDDMLRAVSTNGGAVCANFYSGFLDTDFNRAIKPIWARYEGLPVEQMFQHVSEDAAKLPRQVPLSRLVDHIMHMVEVAGADHVCLGSDFDGVPSLPVGLEDATRLPRLTAALRARGLSPLDLGKVLGDNVLRVLRANEAAAHPAPGRSSAER